MVLLKHIAFAYLSTRPWPVLWMRPVPTVLSFLSGRLSATEWPCRTFGGCGNCPGSVVHRHRILVHGHRFELYSFMEAVIAYWRSELISVGIKLRRQSSGPITWARFAMKSWSGYAGGIKSFRNRKCPASAADFREENPKFRGKTRKITPPPNRSPSERKSAVVLRSEQRFSVHARGAKA